MPAASPPTRRPYPTPRRRVRTILLLAILLGGLTTVATAVVVSLRGGRPAPEFISAVPGDTPDCSTLICWSQSATQAYAHLDPGPYTVQERTGMCPVVLTPPPVLPPLCDAPAWLERIARAHAGPHCDGWQASVHAAGWPLPAMYWMFDARINDARLGFTLEALGKRWGFTPPAGLVPLGVIWPGFLADTAVAALLWTLVLSLGAMLVGRLRRPVYLCRQCGYDLRGTPADRPCPECGAQA